MLYNIHLWHSISSFLKTKALEIHVGAVVRTTKSILLVEYKHCDVLVLVFGAWGIRVCYGEVAY